MELLIDFFDDLANGRPADAQRRGPPLAAVVSGPALVLSLSPVFSLFSFTPTGLNDSNKNEHALGGPRGHRALMLL